MLLCITCYGRTVEWVREQQEGVWDGDYYKPKQALMNWIELGKESLQMFENKITVYVLIEISKGGHKTETFEEWTGSALQEGLNVAIRRCIL